jgi:hypothetical protein
MALPSAPLWQQFLRRREETTENDLERAHRLASLPSMRTELISVRLTRSELAALDRIRSKFLITRSELRPSLDPRSMGGISACVGAVAT